MALLKWAPLDIITARSANNKGIRKGDESELAGIASADREDGDHLYNTDNGSFGVPQVQLKASTNKRSNLHSLIGADATEVSITSATPTQVKDIGFIKDSDGFSGNQINIVARIKQTGGGTTTLSMEIDGAPAITLPTTGSASYVVVTGQDDINALAAGFHTLEFYLSNSTNTGDLELLEVWGL